MGGLARAWAAQAETQGTGPMAGIIPRAVTPTTPKPVEVSAALPPDISQPAPMAAPAMAATAQQVPAGISALVQPTPSLIAPTTTAAPTPKRRRAYQEIV